MTTKGVLLVNLGTPDAPTARAVSRYLRQFLSDTRVIDLPRLPWRLLLNTVILPIRSPKVAKKYHEIWMPEGAPLRVITQQIAKKIAIKSTLAVSVGMRYGNPSITNALLELRKQKIEQLIVLPLFPQYSSATTASIFDAVTSAFSTCPAIPAFHFVHDYHANDAYIHALATTVQTSWAQKGKGQKLIISFHGLPKRYSKKGDPYEKQCQITANLLAQKLGLSADEWILCYQSRFGKAAWLEPYAASVLTELPKKGITAIDIISPGFAVDCLETVEELCLQYRRLFQEAGGVKYEYISALNDSDAHIDFLNQLVSSCIMEASLQS